MQSLIKTQSSTPAIKSVKSNVTLPEIKDRIKKSIGSSGQKEELVRVFQARLDSHKQEIEKNNAIITGLTTNFEILKAELMKEKELTQELEAANKRLRDDLDKTVRNSRASKNKFEDMEKNHLKQLEQLRNSYRDSKNNKDSEEEKKLKKMQSDLQALTKSNQEATKQLETTKSQLKKTAEERDKLKEQVTRMEKQVKNLREQLKINKQRLSTAQVKLDAQAASSMQQQQQLNTIKKLQQQLKQKDEECLQRIKDIKRQLGEDKTKLAGQLKTAKQQIQTLQTRLKGVQYTLSNKEQEFRLRLEEQSNRHRQALSKLTSDLAASRSENSNLKQDIAKYIAKATKYDDVKKLSGKLTESEKAIQNSILCAYCKEEMKQPVTIIPCGHCFCLACKKGYQKECCKCGPKVKIQALYRNQLLDDVLSVYKSVQNINTVLNRP